MVNIQSQKKFSEGLIDYVLSRLTGTHPEDDVVFYERPSKQFFIGTLAARKPHRVDIEKGEESEEETSSKIRVSRLNVSILIKKSDFVLHNSEIMVRGTGNVYFRKFEQESSEKKKFWWKRLEYTYDCKLTINLKSRVDFSKARKIANNDPFNFKEIPDDLWNVKIYYTVKNFGEDVLLTFYFENESIESKEFDGFERTLFNCRLEVDLGNLSNKEFCDVYTYEGHKQKYYYDFRATNCKAKWISEGKRKFITEHAGIFEQDNIRPKECFDIPDSDLTFSNLMHSENAIRALDGFIGEMKKYRDIYAKNIPSEISDVEFQPRKENKSSTWGERKELSKHFKDLADIVERGIYLVKSNPKIKDAFLKTNETFRNHYQNQKVPNAGWRLFQLAFFLLEIASMTEKKNLNTTDVLHVDTGGGKSEAYIALIIFVLFYERSIGRKEGVSALVKFPLRMVSIQQLERLSSFIIHAEAVRKKYSDIFPGSPFSVGYFVGNRDVENSDFPDFYRKVKLKLHEEGKYSMKKGIKKYEYGKLIVPAPRSIVISKCPLCPPDSNGDLRLVDDPIGKRVVHKCDMCGGEYYIYHSDREIYRWRPSVVVSTVDKWVALAYQRRVRSLLGGDGSNCPDGHGFIPSGDECVDENKKDDEDFICGNIGMTDNDSYGPVLSIQDEMHLLTEGFGTIAAHFEGFIDTTVENFNNNILKHIGMSATLNGIKKQVEELYNKENFFVIPGRCPEGVGSSNDFFFKKIDGPKHMICGLLPNLRDNHYATLRTLLHFAEFMFKSQKDLNNDQNVFCKKYDIKDSYDAQELIKLYLIPLTYHIKKQDAYNMERLKDAVVGSRLRRNFNGSDIIDNVLTVESSTGQLKSAMDKIRGYIKNYDNKKVDNEGLIVPAFHATSVISHGVDLDELNFMIFQGLPYSTSEYIQGLSRVGRKNLGIVFLWFRPTNRRDDSFYKNFNRYHNSLDHGVRPIPINRTSRLGLQQTINSIFCASIINYLSNKIGEPCYQKKHVNSLEQEDIEDLIKFIKKIYGKEGLDIDINNEVQERINNIINSDDKPKEYFPNILARSGNPYFVNQTGMRGLQKQFVLDLTSEDESIVKQKEKRP